ncbi:MAG: glycosyltransferase family 4 protein [Candidatus Omnitrophota bacterium]
MKILMLHPHDLWYDPWTIRILELARGLQRRGHNAILCHMPRKDKPEHGHLRTRQPDDPLVYELLPRQKHFLHNYRLLCQLGLDCDILYLQKCFPASTLPLLWAAQRLKKPLHYDWDDNETALARIVEKRFFSRFQLASYERLLPRFASTLTYSSEALKQKALQAGFDPRLMRHLPVGADVQRFRPDLDGDAERKALELSPDKLVVLYLGQLEGAAHARRLVEAAPLVLAHAPDVQFLFAGGGEQLPELRRLAAASPAAHAIKITGYVEASRVPGVITAADICVACFDDDEASRCKSPLKIAEYLACGKPIVASRVGDAAWMTEGCGAVVKPGDLSSLADGILQYALDPSRRKRDGEKARRRALELFTWDRGSETLIELFEETILQR